jgi:hypothetical protein
MTAVDAVPRWCEDSATFRKADARWCLFILLVVATAALTMSAETHLIYGIADATPVLTCPPGVAARSPDTACAGDHQRDLVTDKATAQPAYPSGCLYAEPAYPLPDACRPMLTALPTPVATLSANR